jgi:hypothetical protein
MASGWLPAQEFDQFLRAYEGFTSFPIFRLTLVLGFSLFTGFIVNAYWSATNQPTTNPFPFWDKPNSLLACFALR